MKTKIIACSTAVLLSCRFGGAQTDAPIPWNQIGTKAGVEYKGDGLTVIPTASGARVHCAFQGLDGEATPEGLWLTSTVTNQTNDRFRVIAVMVGREAKADDNVTSRNLRGAPESKPPKVGSCKLKNLATRGEVFVEGQTVRFTRPGLVEEYSVSMDGVRQDFLLLQKPGGESGTASQLASSPVTPTGANLRVELAVSGARVEQSAQGAQLLLSQSGRKIAYSRLKVTDASGKELPARMEVASDDADTSRVAGFQRIGKPRYSTLEFSATRIVVLVDDTAAVYPVRVDPTFSDANWISMGGVDGADSSVYAAAVDSFGNLYIGGDFSVVGNVIANRIAKWNGTAWSALGSGMNDSVRALAVSGDNVYAGGWFTNAGGSAANYIAKWDGSTWSALGSGMSGGNGVIGVYALAVSGSNVYAGGWFTNAGGSAANYIAEWDGNAWSALGSGMGGGNGFTAVYALAVSGSDVYAGGEFWFAGDSFSSYIAKWDGSTWSALGSGTDARVMALAVSGSDLYAGGFFTGADGVTVNNIAKWNGSAWSALGSGMNNNPVLALAVSGSNVYAGGGFSTAGGTPANYIARWNGNAWSALGSGMDSGVLALVASGSILHVGGEFSAAGSSGANCVADWNGNAWNALFSGMNPYVLAVTASGSNVYAGGWFSTAGGTPANHVAKWNGSTWSPLGLGMNDRVTALAGSGSNLYAGGWFTTAGGTAANYIAKWNGSAWSSLGLGMNGGVFGLSVSGSNVYVGGDFTYATNPDSTAVSALRIAKWNGSTWSPLGSGMNGTVLALAVSGSDVYAGGGFTTAGGIAANYIAKWNGSAWNALGPGMNNSVLALVVSGNDVISGGFFTTAGGSTANYVAKWNGSTWSPLGSGMNGSVLALAGSSGDLYAGGTFTTAGGSTANYIAEWNGSVWSGLGSGMNRYVNALAVSGSDLYAGGSFTTAGGKVSAFVAHASPQTSPVLSLFRSGPHVTVSWPSADTAGFMLEQVGTLSASANWVSNTASVIDNGTTKSVTVSATNKAQFFRLHQP